MPQPSPGSLTGASSADATVMTMPTGSQVSGEGRVFPPEQAATGSNARTGGAKRTLKRFTRSTSPRTNIDRSPKRSIERVEIEDARGFEEREMQLIEELGSARVSYKYLPDEHSCLQCWIRKSLFEIAGRIFANDNVQQVHTRSPTRDDARRRRSNY